MMAVDKDDGNFCLCVQDNQMPSEKNMCTENLCGWFVLNSKNYTVVAEKKMLMYHLVWNLAKATEKGNHESL